ncbi:MAG: hypothetical protein ACTSQJ_11455 [Promethearchaeota archaeon]
MDEEDVLEAFAALVGFSLFFLIAIGGTMLESVNPDSYMYVEYTPPLDFFILLGLLFIEAILLIIFLMWSLKFRQSKNLNYRRGELLLTSDKMKYYGILLYLPLQIILGYFYVKYYETTIAIYLFFKLLLGFGLLFLMIYNFYRIKRDIEEE